MSGKLASPLSKRVAVDHPMDVRGKAEHDVLALEFSRLPCLLEQYSSWDLHFSFSFRSVNFSQVWAPLTGHCDPAPAFGSLARVQSDSRTHVIFT
jgi:hypothetical protein